MADILTVAGVAGGAGSRGGRGPRSCRTCFRSAEPGLPPYSVGARAAAHARRARGCGARSRPLLSRGEERGRRELNGARERVGLPPLEQVHGGISQRAGAGGHLPPARVSAAATRRPGVRVTGPLLWEQPFGEVELPPGDDPLVLVAPSTVAGPRAPSCCAPRSRGWPTSRCGCSPRANRRPPAHPLPVPAERAGRRVGLLRADDAAAAPRWSATPATARSPGRSHAACPSWPAPHAGDRPRTPRASRWSGLGVSLPRRFQNARGVRLAVRRLLAEPTYARRAEALQAWNDEHPGPANAAEAVEALAGR